MIPPPSRDIHRMAIPILGEAPYTLQELARMPVKTLLFPMPPVHPLTGAHAHLDRTADLDVDVGPVATRQIWIVRHHPVPSCQKRCEVIPPSVGIAIRWSINFFNTQSVTHEPSKYSAKRLVHWPSMLCPQGQWIMADRTTSASVCDAEQLFKFVSSRLNAASSDFASLL